MEVCTRINCLPLTKNRPEKKDIKINIFKNHHYKLNKLHVRHEIGKQIGVPFNRISICFGTPKIFPFCLAIQIFLSVPVPLFGLPFGTWHTAILRPVHMTDILMELTY